MRASASAVLVVALVRAPACAPPPALPPPSPVVLTTTLPAPGTTVPTLESCPPPAVAPGVLPARASSDPPPPAQVPLDRFTSLAGTALLLWTDQTGAPVLALVRGALPPEPFSEKAEIDVAGTKGVVGPLSDGVWAAAWFRDEADRCEQYSLIFYPPVDRDEVLAVVGSIRG